MASPPVFCTRRSSAYFHVSHRMTISTNIHLPTTQGYTVLKVKNIQTSFLPGAKWKKESKIPCFSRICRSQFRALSNQLQSKQTIFFIVFDFAFEIFTQGPWHQIFHVLPCFSQLIRNLWKKELFFLFCGIKKANTAILVIDQASVIAYPYSSFL